MATASTVAGATTLDLSAVQRTGVMSRLHGLFPSSPQAEPSMTSPVNAADAGIQTKLETPKFIKIRMLTWNMYDSLPKGDLDELLGSVRSADPAYLPHDQPTLPDLPADSDHPYHLVVVACQECPTISGIPRGLGAPEFKLKERDRDKSKDKDKDKDDLPDRPHSRQQLIEPERPKEVEERERPRSVHRFHIHREHSQHRISRDDLASGATSVHSDHTHHTPPYGWSSILEDWYVNGGRHVDNIGDAKPPLLDVHIGDEPPMVNDDVVISPKAKSTGDLTSRMDAKVTSRGPYELLIKERMMGLYLAVFIHRDVKSLVRGTSKSSVTAGLIGGRVGNKGAIGVSINLDGKTFLFINAHLAAHGGKMHHRLANLTKIKTELTVDSFLNSDDPRILREDLTERFDHTFFCGDLNFRLDLTRLHADWLIARKEYAQALAFDQLRNTMESGEAFVGFQEGPIDFPPTFKYDVLRTGRRSKHSIKRSSKAVAADNVMSERLLTEIEEQEREEREALLRAEDYDEEGDGEGEGEGGEAASIASSVWTSVHSRYTVDVEEREPEAEDQEEYFSFSPDTVASTRANASPGNVVQKILTTSAAHKAKAKWMSLIHSPSPDTPWSKVKKKFDHVHSQPLASPSFAIRTATLPSTPGQTTEPLIDGDDKFLKPIRRSESGRNSPTKPRRKSDEIIEGEDPDKGVYDSSHKQRVPSWCDRILWKSTVELQPYNVAPAEEPPPPSPPRTRMGHIFHALRPGMRNRKDSYASTMSVESSQQGPTSPTTSDTDSSDPGHHHTPSPRFLTNNTRPSRLSRSQSNDSMRSHDRPAVSRSFTQAVSHNEANTRPMSTPSSSMPPVPPPKPLFPTPPVDSPPPVPPKDSHRWLSSFLPFLSRDYHSQTNLPLDPPPTREPSPTPSPPRKGEVLCLEYRTLDDRGMRRLEGRSDHRPVIGSYAVYI